MRFALLGSLVLAALFAACGSDAPPSSPALTPSPHGSAGAAGGEDEGGAGGEAMLPVGQGESGAGGEPAGTGGKAGAGAAANAPNTTGCASGAKSPSGAGADMNGGRACLDCHDAKGGPDLVIAGTVFGAPDQPNRCTGASPDGSSIKGAVMTITDVEGTVVDVPVRSKGNFLLARKGHPLVPPFTAKLSWEGRERIKQIPVESGDCNLCHTQKGDDGAEGRIVLP